MSDLDPFAGGTIKYGGQEFPIRPPSFHHVRVIVPAAGRVMPKIAALAASDFSAVDEKLMDDAFAIVFAGIQAGTPGMKREEFEALPCDLSELFAAVPTVMHMAGLRAKEGAPGEATAGTA